MYLYGKSIAVEGMTRVVVKPYWDICVFLSDLTSLLTSKVSHQSDQYGGFASSSTR